MAEFNPTQKFEKIEHNGIEVRGLNIHIGDAHILKDVNVTILMVSGYNLDVYSVKLSYTDYQGNAREIAVPAASVINSGTGVYTIKLTNANFVDGTQFLPPQVNSTVSLIYTVM